MFFVVYTFPAAKQIGPCFNRKLGLQGNKSQGSLATLGIVDCLKNKMLEGFKIRYIILKLRVNLFKLSQNIHSALLLDQQPFPTKVYQRGDRDFLVSS